MPHLISLDTETGGLDFHHGVRPYIVTTCDQSYNQKWWEWYMDPVTRHPEIPASDIEEIRELLASADFIYLQNSKFDARALKTIGVELPWHKVRDTIVMGHLLASNHPHGLDKMCMEYLGYDIEVFEAKVKNATTAARKYVKTEFPDWRLAKEGDPTMPSVDQGSKRDEDKEWKNDMWLPRLLHRELVGQCPPEWESVTREYANADSATTLPLGLQMEKLIRERGHWKQYEHNRIKLPRIAFDLEERGVTMSETNTDGIIERYGAEAAEAEDVCVTIAKKYGHDLVLAKGGSVNDNMRSFFYGSTWLECPRCGKETQVKEWNDVLKDENQLCPKCEKKKGKGHALVHTKVHRRRNLGLEGVYSEKTGGLTMDKDAMDYYLATLDGDPYDFIEALKVERSRAVAVGYAELYKWFWLPTDTDGWRVLYSTYNPFGTHHLRWSMYNPNSANVSNQEDSGLRECFGPKPGREWYRMDFRNIERRIPAYEAEEPKMIEVFENPNQPPYWGNLYCLTASVLYPTEYWPRSEVKDKFKAEMPKLYKRAKFFDLAKQYGCGWRKGDKLSGLSQSFGLVDNEFPMLAKLQKKYLDFANKHGYVETIPDREIDPHHGYPILVGRGDDGRIKPTTIFNYHISGTAMDRTNKGMIRSSEQLRNWQSEGFDGFITIQVHDEVVVDFPAGPKPTSNLPRAKQLQKLMEMGGPEIGLPTPVSLEFILHGKTWADGVAI